MPFYDVRCEECGVTEVFNSVSCVEKEGHTCALGHPAKWVPRPVAIVGVWTDNPVEVGDRQFTSKGELDAFCKQNNFDILSPGSTERKDMKWRANQKANEAAKESGYRDWDDHRAAMRDPQKMRDAAMDAKERKAVAAGGTVQDSRVDANWRK